MRTIWLTVIAVALGAGTSVHAQEGTMEKMPIHSIYGEVIEGWAVQSPYRGAPIQQAQTAAERPPASSLPAAGSVSAPQPAQTAAEGPPASLGEPAATSDSLAKPTRAAAESPPASLGEPVAQPVGPPPAKGGCSGGYCGGSGLGHACRPGCCERLLAWLAYKPHHCCCGSARCCHVPPLYLFYLGDCTEGMHLEYPACCCDCSGLWHGCPKKGPGQGCCGNP